MNVASITRTNSIIATLCILMLTVSLPTVSVAREKKTDAKPPVISAKIEGVKEIYIIPEGPNEKDGEPASPVVDLKLVLTNNGTQDFTFRSVSSDSTRLDLTLEGPGAKLVEFHGRMTCEFRGGKKIVIKPGESHTIQIKDLRTGRRFYNRWIWTEKGNYTLSAALKTEGHTIETEAVTLKVVRLIAG